jgi:hypothetical protein
LGFSLQDPWFSPIPIRRGAKRTQMQQKLFR